MAYQGTNTINAAGIDIPMSIYGGSGSDTITGGDGGNTIYGGTTGGNTITGGAGNDTIYGDGSTSNTITGGSGNDTIYAGNGGDSITGGSGDNQVFGGGGDDTINVSAGLDNWVQAGGDGDTITGGSGNDWLYGGAGTNNITGGGGDERIFGGSGENILTGGGGEDEITGGSGTNYIYGNGVNDLLVGGSGNNYILPDSATGLASVEVKNSDNNLSFDGNINSDGSAYQGDDYAINPDPGYGGASASWNFNDFDSGSRLGDSFQTPVAVYVTWDPSHTSLGIGTQWAENATYTVLDGTTILGTVTVSQQSAPPNDWTEYNDRPWLLLGVWNVGAHDNLSIVLTDSSYVTGDRLCVGDVMTQAIWPTESIRPTDVTINSEVPTAFGGDYTDWFDASQPTQIPIEGSGERMDVQLLASINTLYYQIPGATVNGWDVILPNVAELEFWTSDSSTTPLAPYEDGDILDSLLSDGAFSGTFSVSVAPKFAGYGEMPVTFELKNNETVVEAFCSTEATANSGWTRDAWTSDHAEAIAGTYCSLSGLAQSITGQQGDVVLLKNQPGVVVNEQGFVEPGDKVNVLPLLQALETRLRKSVARARRLIRPLVQFPNEQQEFEQGTNLKSAGINKYWGVKTGTNPLVIDCEGAALVIMAKGLLDVIGAEDFDALYTPITIPTAVSDVPIAQMQIGDWGYLRNDPQYLDKHPDGGYQGENIIKVGPNQYFGFPTGTQTAAKWTSDLIAAYNVGLTGTDRISTIPGWVSEDNDFINVPAVAMALFDRRTGAGESATE